MRSVKDKSEPAAPRAPTPGEAETVKDAAPKLGAVDEKAEAPAIAKTEAKVKAKPKPKPRKGWKFPRLSLWTVLAGLFAIGLALLLANWTSIRSNTLEQAAAVQRAVVEHPEFAIRRVALNGHRRTSRAELLAAIGLDPEAGQISSLRFDAAAARNNLIALPWIAEAEVTLDPSGLLRVEIAERIAAVVWHAEDGHWLLDEEGAKIIAVAGPEARTDLPLLIGFGAETAVSDGRTLLNSLPSALSREIAALVRRGGRRWDAVLTSGLVLKLPAEEPLAALRRYVDEDLGARVAPVAVTAIDLRFPDELPVLRLEPSTADFRLYMLENLRRSDP